jgi:hypothetical protein
VNLGFKKGSSGPNFAKEKPSFAKIGKNLLLLSLA